MQKGKDSAQKKANRYLPYIEELSKVENNLIPIKIEMIHLNSILARVESSKVGMKALPA